MLSRYANKYNHYSDEPHGVINHRNVTVCSTAYSGEHHINKIKAVNYWPLVRGIHRRLVDYHQEAQVNPLVTGGSPHKRAIIQKVPQFVMTSYLIFIPFEPKLRIRIVSHYGHIQCDWIVVSFACYRHILWAARCKRYVEADLSRLRGQGHQSLVVTAHPETKMISGREIQIRGLKVFSISRRFTDEIAVNCRVRDDHEVILLISPGTFRKRYFQIAISGMKSFVFWLKCHWNLSLRIQLTISQHWFR